MKIYPKITILTVLACFGLSLIAGQSIAGGLKTDGSISNIFCANQVTATAPVQVAPQSRIKLASRRTAPVIALTCGTRQWCCKHDIGGTGACTKCCPK